MLDFLQLCDQSQYVRICQFFLLGVIWQFVSHKFRFACIKYYLNNGYKFELPNDLGDGDNLRSLGLTTMGFSYHPRWRLSPSWFVDIFYVILFLLLPLFSLKYILTALCLDLSFRTYFIWLTMNVFLIIAFNRRRYKYYKSKPYWEWYKIVH